LNGDVWVVSGVDDTLKELKWRRYAAGLYEPLGLKVVDDKVYVLGRDQITRLHDLNGDGEADFYENFNNDAPCSANYHGFAFDLCTDSAGNFYYTRAGQRMNPKLPDHGALLRVSRDGSKLEPVAAGLRAANGMAVGPGDLITVGDNQGNWTPSSKINVIKTGGFYGYMPHLTAAGLRQAQSSGGSPRGDYDPPLCWIPVSVDNSSGSQVWTSNAAGKFGPLSGRLFHTSYGMASLMLVTMQKLDAASGLYQGGVIPLPLKFDSGVMRGRMNPKDGQLYLSGLRGWQTAGTRDGTLCRVRYTGKPLYLPTDVNVGTNDAINLTFGVPLDPATAEDPGSYGVEQWNYRWSAEYGSPDFSVKDPARQGHDDVAVTSAKLGPDRKTVLLTIPGLRPVMQMRIRVNVDAADGTTIDHSIYLTIHRVPGAAKP
jgi:glucose/arabinose dehydrogenase